MKLRLIASTALAVASTSCAPDNAQDPIESTSDGSGGEPTTSSSSSSSSTSIADTSSSGASAAEDPETSSSEGSTGDAPPTCTLPDGSPPTTMLDAYVVEPIDVLAIHATLRFDASTETASGVAEMHFRAGPTGGLPTFDLRQEITAARLDGEALGANAAPPFAPSDDPTATMRVLNAEVEPCSEHTLELEYTVISPPGATFPIYDPAGVIWSSNLSDLAPGRFAEMWMPANLPHDELDLVLDIEVLGTRSQHLLTSNGEVESQRDGQWTITFPPHFTSMSPLVVLAPTAITEHATEMVELPDGHTVDIEVLRLPSESEQMVDLVAQSATALSAANLELGEYPHGDRYLVFASGLIGGMEYPGGTESAFFAIPHEAFHSWIARGIRPLRHRDAWIDEAWTMWATDYAYVAEPLTPRSPASTMAPEDPWLRETPFTAYMVGPNMLAMFAETVGTDELRGILREFYVAHAGDFVTTEAFEAHLAAALGDELVMWAFDRFVTGMPS